VVVGKRRIFVVSERVLLKALGEKRKGMGFGARITPVYVLMLEGRQNYAFSLETGEGIEFDEVFSRIPSLNKEMFKKHKEMSQVIGNKSSSEQILFNPDDLESLF